MLQGPSWACPPRRPVISQSACSPLQPGRLLPSADLAVGGRRAHLMAGSLQVCPSVSSDPGLSGLPGAVRSLQPGACRELPKSPCGRPSPPGSLCPGYGPRPQTESLRHSPLASARGSRPAPQVTPVAGVGAASSGPAHASRTAFRGMKNAGTPRQEQHRFPRSYSEVGSF